MYFVYISKRINFNRYYIGSTEDIKRRLLHHSSGKIKSTKAYKPWEIVYSESYNTRSEAFKKEKQIKSYKGGVVFKKLLL